MATDKLYLLNFQNTVETTIISGGSGDTATLSGHLVNVSGTVNTHTTQITSLNASVANLSGSGLTSGLINTSAKLRNIVLDEVGEGFLVFNSSPSFTGTMTGDIITVNDDPYSSTTWDSSLQVPTKNAVRDVIVTLSGLVVNSLTSGSIDTSSGLRNIVTDEVGSGFLVFNNSPSFTGTITADIITVNNDPYDATTWNSSIQVPTKDAIRDKIETVLTTINTLSGLTTGVLVTGSIDTSAKLRGIVTDEVGSGFLVFNNTTTLTGDTTFGGSILPPNSGIYNIGSSTVPFGTGYINIAIVQGETYAVGWQNDFSVPTKHDLYTKIEGITGVTFTGTLSGTSTLSFLDRIQITAPQAGSLWIKNPITNSGATVSVGNLLFTGNITGYSVLSGGSTRITLSNVDQQYSLVLQANNEFALMDNAGNQVFYISPGAGSPSINSDFPLIINNTIQGTSVSVGLETYGTGWSSDGTVPTKGDIYNKIESLESRFQSGVILDVSRPPWSLIPVNGLSGSGQEAATYNTIQLNKIFNDQTSGILVTKQTVFFPGNGYCINDTITIPAKTAIRVDGQGLDYVFSENPWYKPSSALGGPSSRLIWIGSGDRPMIRNFCHGLRWDGVMLQGKLLVEDAEYQGLLASGEAPLTAPLLNQFAMVGMQVANNTSGLSCGKLTSTLFQASMCRTGLVFGSGIFTNNNADESWIGYLRGSHCGVLLSLNTNNAQLFTIGQFIPYRCNTGLYVSGGGNITIQHAVAIAPTGVLVATELLDVNTPIIKMETVSVDNDFAKGRVVKMNQPRLCYIRIGDMFVGNTIPTGIDSPLFEISGQATLSIGSCFMAYEGMIRAGYNIANTLHRPTINVSQFRMQTEGMTPDNLIEIGRGSTGTMTLWHQGCHSYLGLNTYQSKRLQWINGVITTLSSGA